MARNTKIRQLICAECEKQFQSATVKIYCSPICRQRKYQRSAKPRKRKVQALPPQEKTLEVKPCPTPFVPYVFTRGLDELRK